MRQVDEWLSRWQDGRTGFHQSAVDQSLRLNWPSVGCSPTARVLVPLCGKSLDMMWLRSQGHPVVGIEVSPVAVEHYLLEAGIAARRSVSASHQTYVSERLELVCGDFFRFEAMKLQRFDAVYDRAAFGAMAPQYRDLYVNCLRAATHQGSRILLTVLEYPESDTSGPPFSLTCKEIRARFGAYFSSGEVSRKDILEMDARMRSRGVTRLHEVAYLLERQ